MPKEFKVAVTIIQVIEKTFNIQVPLDEIGYITLFLGKDILSMNNINTKENVKIILCMHGDTTATSMSQFVNELVESNVEMCIRDRWSTILSIWSYIFRYGIRMSSS